MLTRQGVYYQELMDDPKTQWMTVSSVDACKYMTHNYTLITLYFDMLTVCVETLCHDLFKKLEPTIIIFLLLVINTWRMF